MVALGYAWPRSPVRAAVEIGVEKADRDRLRTRG